MHNFGQYGLWRKMPEDKLISLITLEQEKEKEYWETLNKVLGGK